MNVIPRSNWVVIKLDTAEKSKGGLFLPQSAATAGEGTVQVVGPKVKSLAAGQRVLYDKAKQMSAGADNVAFVMVREDEIRAVLTSE